MVFGAFVYVWLIGRARMNREKGAEKARELDLKRGQVSFWKEEIGDKVVRVTKGCG